MKMIITDTGKAIGKQHAKGFQRPKKKLSDAKLDEKRRNGICF